jgi:hypothetical protein
MNRHCSDNETLKAEVALNQHHLLTKELRFSLSSRAKPTCPGVPWRDLR